MKAFVIAVAILAIGCSSEKSVNPAGPSAGQVAVETADPVQPIEPCVERSTNELSADGLTVTFKNDGNCEPAESYVFLLFRRNSTFTDQALLRMASTTLTAGQSGTLRHDRPGGYCYQTDFYVGITEADISSGRVLVHPRDIGAPNFVAPNAFYVSPQSECRAPEPPPAPPGCPVGGTGGVFWQVSSSATIDVGTNFVGNILALTSISMNPGATLQGRALARNGAVTLSSNTIGVSTLPCPNPIPPALSPYAVLAGTTVTCTGASTITGDIGVAPGTAITGFPAPCVDVGTLRTPPASDAGQAALTASYLTLAGLSCGSTIGPDLAGLTLTPGVYCVTAGATNLSGTVTLNRLGNPAALFVFKFSSTLITSPGSTVMVQ